MPAQRPPKLNDPEIDVYHLSAERRADFRREYLGFVFQQLYLVPYLTAVQNVLLGAKLSEYHTGYRAYSRELLEKLDLSANSNDFVFDSEFIAQALWLGYPIAEVSCPTKYFPEASSINFRRSVVYGFGCLRVAGRFFLSRHLGLPRPPFLAVLKG